jgi:hypothetical protein
MRSKKIRTKLEKTGNVNGKLGGWLSGPQTYLWFGVNDECRGTLSGPKLLRLAKAIVRHMESAHD